MALPTPTSSTMTTSRTWEGCGESTDQRHAEREDELLDGEEDQEALAVDLVGQQAAHHGQDQGGPQLGEDDDARRRCSSG